MFILILIFWFGRILPHSLYPVQHGPEEKLGKTHMNLAKAHSSECKCSIFVAEDDQVYGWGRATTGFKLPELLDLPKINGDTPKLISGAFGMYHSILLTSTHDIIGWGSNSQNELGSHAANQVAKPELLHISLPSPPVRLVASASGSGAMTKDGSLYIWGERFGGTPTKIDVGEPVIDFAGGLAFQLLLTESGKVYGIGDNQHGQILQGGSNKISEFTHAAHIPDDYKLTRIYAGCRHSFGLTKEGILIAWGCNMYGCLGIGNTSPITHSQVILTGVMDVACGWGHSLALMKDGSVSIWGTGFDGQLAGDRVLHAPKKLSFPGIEGKSIGFIGCGFSHTFVATVEGVLYLWGSGGNGQIGDGKQTQANEPYEIPELRWKVCQDSHEEWETTFQWLFMGHKDDSCFSVFPVEVLYHFVILFFRNKKIV
jgi:alpha-tubulin suppressor-like RCC1 family protein